MPADNISREPQDVEEPSPSGMDASGLVVTFVTPTEHLGEVLCSPEDNGTQRNHFPQPPSFLGSRPHFRMCVHNGVRGGNDREHIRKWTLEQFALKVSC